MADIIRSEALAALPHFADVVDFIPREHDECIFFEQMVIWNSSKIEVAYILFPYSEVAQLIEHGITCPFEPNAKGVAIGFAGELNFPFGNGIYCFKNFPDNFDKQRYFVIVAAVLVGVDCRKLEAMDFDSDHLPCDSILVSDEVWVLRSASQLLPLFTF